MYTSNKKFYLSIVFSLCLLLFISVVFVSAADFRFVVMADSRGSSNGVNTTELGIIMSRIAALSPQPKFILFPGDMINGSSNVYATVSSQLQTWKNTVSAYYGISSIYPGVGNHETNNGASYAAETAFHDIFPEFSVNDQLAGYNKTVYLFDYDNSRFIMLNSNHVGYNHKIDATQRAWLTPKLSGKTHCFVFCHEPAYPIGPHYGSSLDVNPSDRDAFWQIADNANITLFFCGHEHNYNRRLIDTTFNAAYHNDIYQVTTGTCGAPFEYGTTDMRNVITGPIYQYHFAVVDVSGDDVTVHVYQDNMTQLDYFTVFRTAPTYVDLPILEME